MSNGAHVLIGHKGKSILDTGVIYAPYIPILKTPTFMEEFTKTKNTPLEDFAEGVFAEEIESGELHRVRKDAPAEAVYNELKHRIATRYTANLIKPEYFSTVTVTNLT